MLSVTKDKLIRTLQRVLALLILYFVQNLFAWIRVANAAPLLLTSGAVALALIADGEWGAAWGMFAGLLCDISVGGSPAFFTITLTAAGLGTGLLVKYYLARTLMTFLLLSLAVNAAVLALQLVPMVLFKSIALDLLMPSAIAQFIYSAAFMIPIHLTARKVAGFSR